MKLALAAFVIVEFAACSSCATLPTGSGGSEADALAHKVEAWVNKDAWDKTGAVRFGFKDKRVHLWDKQRGFLIVTNDGAEAQLDLWDHGGFASKNGVELRIRARVTELLGAVGLEESARLRYPHEFSGGQRQRIGLARALMLKPDVLIADEPVSALDVTVQAQVLELLDKVRRQMNLAMLFITHDMRVAARICHRVMVMRHGQVVEEGPTGALFAAPKSEYTGRLLAAIPGRQRLEA